MHVSWILDILLCCLLSVSQQKKARNCVPCKCWGLLMRRNSLQICGKSCTSLGPPRIHGVMLGSWRGWWTQMTLKSLKNPLNKQDWNPVQTDFSALKNMFKHIIYHRTELELTYVFVSSWFNNKMEYLIEPYFLVSSTIHKSKKTT